MVMVRMVGAVAMFFKRGGGRGRTSSVVRVLAREAYRGFLLVFIIKVENHNHDILHRFNLLRSQLFYLVIIFLSNISIIIL